MSTPWAMNALIFLIGCAIVALVQRLPRVDVAACDMKHYKPGIFIPSHPGVA